MIANVLPLAEEQSEVEVRRVTADKPCDSTQAVLGLELDSLNTL